MGSGIHKKTSIYLATVIAVLALTACGEKKSARGSEPADAPKSTTTVEETSGTGSGGVDLPPPEVPGSTPTPTPSDASSAGPIVKKNPYTDSGYEPVDPSAPEKADTDKRYTGMSDDDGLRYTGSSTDYLLTYLRLRNEDPNLDDSVKSRNLDAAQSIRSAHLTRDEDTGDISISLKIKEGNSLKNYVLAGGLGDDDNAVASLRLAKGRNGVKTTGSQSIEGKIKCLDEDGGCETMFARLVIGDASSGRSAVAIVFRQSLADLRASITSSDGNPEYDTIRDFWINSQNDANTDLKLKKAVLKSFEVVNGRSGFEVQIISEDRQLMSFGGPLLAPDAGTSVDIAASRGVELQESYDLDNIAGYKQDLANFIGSARVINNNGLGQVRLALKMRKRVGYNQEAFKLTVMRIIKQTVEPNEENLKFK